MENSKNKEETKMSEVLNVEEIFGSKVFTLGKMRERLPKSVYHNCQRFLPRLILHSSSFPPYSCYFPCFLRLTCTVAIQNLHAQNRIFDAFLLLM